MTAVPVDARFTPGQAEHLARVEAAPFAEEGAVERVARVARAIHAADRSYSGPWEDVPPRAQDDYCRLAVAALAAMCPATGHDPHAAIRRVEELAEAYDKRATYGGALVWSQIRAALRPTDVAGDGEQR